MKYNIAIVGATGMVGRKTLQILAEQGLEDNNFYLFATKKSVGKKLKIGNKSFCIEELSLSNLLKHNLNYALFCVNENVSKIYAKPLLKKNVKVIDFSSFYRSKFPLIVPEINFEDVKNSNLICNPNCSTAQSVMALNMISKKFGLSNIVYSSYQAVSGAGKVALDDLKRHNQKKLKKLNYPIKNNLISFIGDCDKTGYSTEENKMIFETKKILHLTECDITATCVRIPIKNCHLVSITFKTKKNCHFKQIEETLKSSPGIIYSAVTPPMPIIANDNDFVYVGRLRAHKTIHNCFSMLVCADNLRKGASLNGVQILKKLMETNNDI